MPIACTLPTSITIKLQNEYDIRSGKRDVEFKATMFLGEQRVGIFAIFGTVRGARQNVWSVAEWQTVDGDIGGNIPVRKSPPLDTLRQAVEWLRERTIVTAIIFD